jgi:hypothetical protein
MRPLFTIHAGEVLVGQHLEHKYKTDVNIWVPAKDTGIDLLVTDKKNKKMISLQVKFSKDHLPSLPNAEIRKQMRACGWLSLNRESIVESTADYWVFVLLGFKSNSHDFIIITPKELLKRLDAIYPGKKSRIDTHLWVTEKKECWDTRGLNAKDKQLIAQGSYDDKKRNFTDCFDDWSSIEELSRNLKNSVRSTSH